MIAKREITNPCPRRHRRGSVYLAVLGAATLVTIIGLSALLIARIRHRRAGDASELAQRAKAKQAMAKAATVGAAG